MKGQSQNNGKLAEFFAEEYDHLERYVSSRLRDPEYDSGDIVQDVALNLFTKADISSQIENVAAYVYRALKNKVIDLLRKKRQPKMSLDDDYSGPLQAEVADDAHWESENRMWRDEQFDLAMEVLTRLKPKQQEIILATELEGHSFETLSKEWDIPIGTLLSRKHRAMAKLQVMLAEENEKINQNERSIK